MLTLLALLAPADAASFTITLTNTGTAAWAPGVLTVRSPYAAPPALLPTGPRPMTAPHLDSYAYGSVACDLVGEDDGDAALLASKWGCATCSDSDDDTTTAGIVVQVPAIAAGQSTTVTFDATFGVMSFLARVQGSPDDVVMMHPAARTVRVDDEGGGPPQTVVVPADLADTTVDLFDAFGAPLAEIAYDLDYYDVSSVDPDDPLAADCPVVCPDDAIVVIGVDDTGYDAPLVDPLCFIVPGGAVDLPSQPVRGGCPAVAVYHDVDGDGNAGTREFSCVVPEAPLPAGNDCDDANPSVGGPTVAAFVDADGDGYGAGASTLVCALGAGFATKAGDCDDARSGVNPGATEVCGGFDDDCDNLVDGSDPSFDATGAPSWYPDVDKDGYGDTSAATKACAQPTGHVALAGDCDDDDAAIRPGATEVCGAPDEDCDGLVDDLDPGLDPASAFRWFRDAYGDGHGTPDDDRVACAPGAGWSPNAADCDDASDVVFEGALELCDELDNDCDLDVDEDAAGTPAWEDADDDGFGAGEPVLVCGLPDGHADQDGDCAPDDAAIHPDATEIPGNEIDEDCDGLDEIVPDDTDPVDTDTAVDSDTGTVDSPPDDDRPPPEVPDTAAEPPPPPACGCRAVGRADGVAGLFFALALLARRARRA